MNNYRSTLLIDDDHINNFIITRLLQKTGFSNEVLALKNGNEALSYLQFLLKENTPIPDFIFLDINMPGISGPEFIKELKTLVSAEHFPKIAVVSNAFRDCDKHDMQQLGIFLFIDKPLTKEKLEAL